MILHEILEFHYQ